MAESVGLTQVAAALKDHFGPRLVAGREEGRRMMVEALAERLGLPEGEAGQRVEALEQAHTIRWIQRRGPTIPHVSTPFAEAIGPESQAGPGSPAEADLIAEEGYWQL